MKEKMKVHVAMVIDQSGSMYKVQEEVVDHYNEIRQSLISRSKDEEIDISLVTFNQDVHEHLWLVKAEELVEANVEDFETGGTTARRDAVGYTIDKLLETTKDDENCHYIIKIISDGRENDSKYYTENEIRNLINRVQSTGRWTITLLGHKAEYLREVAVRESIPVGNTAVWNNNTKAMAKKCLRASSQSFDKYIDSLESGATTPLGCFYSADNSVADFASLPDIVEPDNNIIFKETFSGTADDSSTSSSGVTLTTSAPDGSRPFYNKMPVTWNKTSYR